jgi:hypothetical protein
MLQITWSLGCRRCAVLLLVACQHQHEVLQLPAMALLGDRTARLDLAQCYLLAVYLQPEAGGCRWLERASVIHYMRLDFPATPRAATQHVARLS